QKSLSKSKQVNNERARVVLKNIENNLEVPQFVDIEENDVVKAGASAAVKEAVNPILQSQPGNFDLDPEYLDKSKFYYNHHQNQMQNNRSHPSPERTPSMRQSLQHSPRYQHQTTQAQNVANQQQPLFQNEEQPLFQNEEQPLFENEEEPPLENEEQPPLENNEQPPLENDEQPPNEQHPQVQNGSRPRRIKY
ncbi:hypothetical protein TSAR_016896, partial [Trichomalopsis sarcophagae]